MPTTYTPYQPAQTISPGTPSNPSMTAQTPVTFTFDELTDMVFTHNFGRRASIRIIDSNGMDITGSFRKMHTENTVRLVSNQPKDGEVTFS